MGSKEQPRQPAGTVHGGEWREFKGDGATGAVKAGLVGAAAGPSSEHLALIARRAKVFAGRFQVDACDIEAAAVAAFAEHLRRHPDFLAENPDVDGYLSTIVRHAAYDVANTDVPKTVRSFLAALAKEADANPNWTHSDRMAAAERLAERQPGLHTQWRDWLTPAGARPRSLDAMAEDDRGGIDFLPAASTIDEHYDCWVERFDQPVSTWDHIAARFDAPAVVVRLLTIEEGIQNRKRLDKIGGIVAALRAYQNGELDEEGTKSLYAPFSTAIDMRGRRSSFLARVRPPTPAEQTAIADALDKIGEEAGDEGIVAAWRAASAEATIKKGEWIADEPTGDDAPRAYRQAVWRAANSAGGFERLARKVASGNATTAQVHALLSPFVARYDDVTNPAAPLAQRYVLPDDDIRYKIIDCIGALGMAKAEQLWRERIMGEHR